MTDADHTDIELGWVRDNYVLKVMNDYDTAMLRYMEALEALHARQSSSS